MAYTLGFTHEVFGLISAAWKGVWCPKIGMLMVMVGIELATMFLMNTHIFASASPCYRQMNYSDTTHPLLLVRPLDRLEGINPQCASAGMARQKWDQGNHAAQAHHLKMVNYLKLVHSKTGAYGQLPGLCWKRKY